MHSCKVVDRVAFVVMLKMRDETEGDIVWTSVTQGKYLIICHSSAYKAISSWTRCENPYELA